MLFPHVVAENYQEKSSAAVDEAGPDGMNNLRRFTFQLNRARAILCFNPRTFCLTGICCALSIADRVAVAVTKPVTILAAVSTDSLNARLVSFPIADSPIEVAKCYHAEKRVKAG